MSETSVTNQKSYLVTGILALVFGIFGADRFYLGKTGTAIAKLLTLGGCGVWVLIDLIILLAGNVTDSKGQPLSGATTRNKLILVGVLIVLMIIGAVTPKGSVSSMTPTNNSEQQAEWTTVATLSGTSEGAVSESFTVGSGEKRVVYSLNGGSFLLYAAPEGVDIDTEGALPIMAGTMDGTDQVESVTLEPGTYNLDLRPVLTDSWTVTLQEKN